MISSSISSSVIKSLPPTLQLFRAVADGNNNSNSSSSSRPAFLESHCDIAIIDFTFESGTFNASSQLIDIISTIVDKLPQTVVVAVLRVDTSPSIFHQGGTFDAETLANNNKDFSHTNGGAKTNNYHARQPNRIVTVVLPPSVPSHSNNNNNSSMSMMNTSTSSNNNNNQIRHSVDSLLMSSGGQVSAVGGALRTSLEGCNTPLRSFLQVASFVIGRFQLRMAPSTFAEMLLSASKSHDVQSLAVLSSISTTHVEAQLETAVQSNAVLSPFIGREHLLEYGQFLDADIAAGSAECGIQLVPKHSAIANAKPGIVAPSNIDVILIFDCNSHFLADSLRKSVVEKLSDYDRCAIFSAGTILQVPSFCKDISKSKPISASSEHVRTGAVTGSISQSLSAAEHVIREWSQSSETRGSRRQGIVVLITDGSEDSLSSTTTGIKQSRLRQWESVTSSFGCSGHVICLGRAQVRDMFPLAQSSFGTVQDVAPVAGKNHISEHDTPVVAESAAILTEQLVNGQRSCFASSSAILVRARPKKKDCQIETDSGNKTITTKLSTVAELFNSKSHEITRTQSVISSMGTVSEISHPKWFGSARKDQQLPRNFDPDCTSWDVFVAYRAHSSGPAFLIYRQIQQSQFQRIDLSLKNRIFMNNNDHNNSHDDDDNNNNGNSSFQREASFDFAQNHLSSLAIWADSWNRLNDMLFGSGRSSAAPLLQQWDITVLQKAFANLCPSTVKRLEAYRSFLASSQQQQDSSLTSSYASPQSLFERATLVAKSNLVILANASTTSPEDEKKQYAEILHQKRQQQQQQQQNRSENALLVDNSFEGDTHVHYSPDELLVQQQQRNSNRNISPSRRKPQQQQQGSSPPSRNSGAATSSSSKVRVVSADELAEQQYRERNNGNNNNNNLNQQGGFDLPPQNLNHHNQHPSQVPPLGSSSFSRNNNNNDDSTTNDGGDGGGFRAKVTMIGENKTPNQQQSLRGMARGMNNNNDSSSNNNIDNENNNNNNNNNSFSNQRSPNFHKEDPDFKTTTTSKGDQYQPTALVDPRWLQLGETRPKSASVEAAICRCLPAGRVVTDSSFSMTLAKFESGNVFIKFNSLPPLASYGSAEGRSTLARKVFLFSVDAGTGDLEIMQTAPIKESDRAVCFEKVPRGSHCCAVFVVYEARPRLRTGGWISINDFLVVDGIEFETPSSFAKSVDVWDIRETQAHFRWEGVSDSFVLTLRPLASIGGKTSSSYAAATTTTDAGVDFDNSPITSVVSDGAMTTTIDSLRPFTVYWIQVAPCFSDVVAHQRTKAETANAIFCTAPSLQQEDIHVAGHSLPASSTTASISITAPRLNQIVNWQTSASGHRSTYAITAEPALTLGASELRRNTENEKDPLDASRWLFKSEVPMSTILPLQIGYVLSIKQITDGTASATILKSWRTDRLVQFPVGPFSFLRGVRVTSVRSNSVVLTWTSDPFAKFVATVQKTSSTKKKRGGKRQRGTKLSMKSDDDDDNENSSNDDEDDDDEEEEEEEAPKAIHVAGSPIPGQHNTDVCGFRAILTDLSADTGYNITVAGHGCLNPEVLAVRTTPAAPTIDDIQPTHDYINGNVAVLLAPASEFEDIRAFPGQEEDSSDDDNKEFDDDDFRKISAGKSFKKRRHQRELERRKRRQQRKTNNNNGNNDEDSTEEEEDDNDDKARVTKHVEIVATVLPLGAEVWSDDANAHVESTLPVNSKTSWALSITREVVFKDPKSELPIRGRALPEMPSLVSDPLELFIILDIQVEQLVLNRQLDLLFRARRLGTSPVTATLGSTTADTIAVKRKELEFDRRRHRDRQKTSSLMISGQSGNNSFNNTQADYDTIRGVSKDPTSPSAMMTTTRRNRNNFSGSDNDDNDDDDDDEFAPLHRAMFALPRRQEGDAIGSLLRFTSPQLVPSNTKFFALLSCPDLSQEDIYSRVFEDRLEITIPQSAPIWNQLLHDSLYTCSGISPVSSSQRLPKFEKVDLRPYIRWNVCTKTSSGWKKFPITLPNIKMNSNNGQQQATSSSTVNTPRRGTSPGSALFTTPTTNSSKMGGGAPSNMMMMNSPHRSANNNTNDNNNNNNNEPFQAPTFAIPLNPNRHSSNVEDLYCQIVLEPVVETLTAASQSLVCVNAGAMPRSKNPLHLRCPVVYDVRSLQLESSRPVLRGKFDETGKCMVRWHSAAPEFEVTMKDLHTGQQLQTVRTSSKNAEVPVYPNRAVVISVSGPQCGGHEVSMVLHFPGKYLNPSFQQKSSSVSPPSNPNTGRRNSARDTKLLMQQQSQQQLQQTLATEPEPLSSLINEEGELINNNNANPQPDEFDPDQQQEQEQQQHHQPSYEAQYPPPSSINGTSSYKNGRGPAENIDTVDHENVKALLQDSPGVQCLIETSGDFKNAKLSVPSTGKKTVRVTAATWPHGAGTIEVTTRHSIRRSDSLAQDLLVSSPEDIIDNNNKNEVEIPLVAPNYHQQHQQQFTSSPEKSSSSSSIPPVRLPHFLRYSTSVCKFIPEKGTAPVTFPPVEGLPERMDVCLAPKIDTVDSSWLAVSWAGSADFYEVTGWVVAENDTNSMIAHNHDKLNDTAAAFASGSSYGLVEVVRCQRDVPRVSLSVARLQGKALCLRIRSVATRSGLASNTLTCSILVPLPPPLLSAPIIRAGLFGCKLPRPHFLRDSGGTVHANYSINDGRGHAMNSENGKQIGNSEFFRVHLRLPIVSAPTKDATVGTCLPCTISLIRQLTLAPAAEPLRQIFPILNDAIEASHPVALPELHTLETLRVSNIQSNSFDLSWISTASTFDVSVTALIGSEAHLHRKGNTFFGGTTRNVRVSEPRYTVQDCIASSIYLIEIKSLQCGDAALKGSLVTNPAFAPNTALIRRDKSGSKCSLDIECNQEPFKFCVDTRKNLNEFDQQSNKQNQQNQKQSLSNTYSSASSPNEEDYVQTWTVMFEDTIELKRLSGAVETLGLSSGDCVGVGPHRKPCFSFNIPISSAITEVYWKKSCRVVFNNKNSKNKSNQDGDHNNNNNKKKNSEGQNEDDDENNNNQQDDLLLAAQEEEKKDAAATEFEYLDDAGNPISPHEGDFKILNRIGISVLNLCSIPFVPRIEGFNLGELHSQRVTLKWSCSAPSSAVAGFSVQASALAVLPFRDLSSNQANTFAPRALRSARGGVQNNYNNGPNSSRRQNNNNNNYYSSFQQHQDQQDANNNLLLGAVQTRVLSVDGGADRQVNLVGLHPGAVHEVIVRAELQGSNAVSIIPKYSTQFPDVLQVEDESCGTPEGTCYFLTPPIRPASLPYRRYTGCVETIFDAKRLTAPKFGLLGYIAVRAIPDNLVFVASPPGDSAQQSDLPTPKLALKSDTTTFVVAKGVDQYNDQLAVVQWHVNEPADASTHMLEHYAVIEAVEGSMPQNIWKGLLNRAAWSEPEDQSIRLLRAVSRPLIMTAGSDRLDVSWQASHDALRFDVTYMNLTPKQNRNSGDNDDIGGSEMVSQSNSPAVTPILSNFEAANQAGFPSNPHQASSQQQHVIRVAQSFATLDHLTHSSLYCIDVCASHDDVPCQPTSFLALTAPKRRKPPRIHCVGLSAAFELPKSIFETVTIPNSVAASSGAVGENVPSAITLSGMGGETEATRSLTALVFTLPEDPAVGLGPLRDCRTAAEYLALADSRNTFRSHPDAAQRIEVQLRAGRSYMFCFFWSIHHPTAINTVAHSKVVAVEHRADVMAPSNLHVITRTKTSVTVGWVPPDRSSAGQQFEVECSTTGVYSGGNKNKGDGSSSSPGRRAGSPSSRNRKKDEQASDRGPKVITATVGGPLPDGSHPAVLKTHHTFIGLESGQHYNFRVRSISAGGASSPWCAQPLVNVTVLTTPKPVDNVDVLSVTDHSVAISWIDTKNVVGGAAAVQQQGAMMTDVQSADVLYTVHYKSEVSLPSKKGSKNADGTDSGPATGRSSASSKFNSKFQSAKDKADAEAEKQARMAKRMASMSHAGEVTTAHRYVEIQDLRPNTKYVVTIVPKNHLGEVSGGANASVTLRTAATPEDHNPMMFGAIPSA